MTPEATRTLFDDADELSVTVPTSCRRTGRCRECIVEVKAGAEHLCPPSAAEEFLRAPFRLACQARVDDADGHCRVRGRPAPPAHRRRRPTMRASRRSTRW